MPEWRSKGDDAVDFVHDGPARTVRGDRWRDHRGPDRGVTPPIDGGITGAGQLRRAADAVRTGWPPGQPGRDPKTVAKSRLVLEPVLAVIGTVRLRDLDVTNVDRALAAVAASRSSATVAMALPAITRAQAKNQILRNVSALTGAPPGTRGRPSHSMTSPRRPR